MITYVSTAVSLGPPPGFFFGQKNDILGKVKSTLYFKEQVLRKRPYIKSGWIRKALKKPKYKYVQKDGRIRYFVYITKLGKYLRVVTLSDGVTVHNAFPDRNFKGDEL